MSECVSKIGPTSKIIKNDTYREKPLTTRFTSFPLATNVKKIVSQLVD